MWIPKSKSAFLWIPKRQNGKFLSSIPPFLTKNRRILGVVDSQTAYFGRKGPNCGFPNWSFGKFSKVGVNDLEIPQNSLIFRNTGGIWVLSVQNLIPTIGIYHPYGVCGDGKLLY